MSRQENRGVSIASLMTSQGKSFMKKQLFGKGFQSMKVPLSVTTNPIALPSLYDQIDYAAGILKEKTISLVCLLRKYSLQPELEAQIEHYLTDVLDQMDLVLAKKNACDGREEPKLQRDHPSNFEQLQKPTGDDECIHLQQTFRQLPRSELQPIQQLSKQATQVELSNKLQNILSELEYGGNSYTRSSNNQQKPSQKQSQASHAWDQVNDVPNENRSRVETKAHRFSNSYIRDVNRAKKNRLL